MSQIETLVLVMQIDVEKLDGVQQIGRHAVINEFDFDGPDDEEGHDVFYFDPASITADIDNVLREELFGEALNEYGAIPWTGAELIGEVSRGFRKADYREGAGRMLGKMGVREAMSRKAR